MGDREALKKAKKRASAFIHGDEFVFFKRSLASIQCRIYLIDNLFNWQFMLWKCQINLRYPGTSRFSMLQGFRSNLSEDEEENIDDPSERLARFEKAFWSFHLIKKIQLLSLKVNCWRIRSKPERDWSIVIEKVRNIGGGRNFDFTTFNRLVGKQKLSRSYQKNIR